MTLKKTMNSIGWKYGLMGVLYILVEVVLGRVLMHFLPESLDKYQMYFTFAIMVFTVDIVCFPFVLLITHNMPKANIKKKNLGVGKFFLCVLMMYGLVLVGTIIGLTIHSILTIPFSQQADDGLVTMMLDSNFFIRVLVVGILAPIFEELIFRKVLIDHVAPKGELVAVLASGLMFGLFHGNFQQGFFAAFIGCLFAYIYLKTGKVIYTILLHMFLNTVTSGITIEILKALYKVIGINGENIDAMQSVEFIEANPEMTSKIMIATGILLLWLFTLLGTMFAGLVIVITFSCVKTFKFKRKEGDESFGRQALSLISSPGMWIFYVICMFLFGITYLPPIVITLVDAIKNLYR
ncbi:MAG: CPBP family intramembrane metalloprotease [Lachnospiraceae bacterium]|nr:CPBP family intramembrane metalloprotease [Lachnospiraceae bacterium]